MLRRSVACLGRKTEFLKKLDLISEGMEQKRIEKKFWSQVYSDECVMKSAGQEVVGLQDIVRGMPGFHHAFDVKTNVVEVLGEEDAEKFAVHFKHSVRFVGEYGRVEPTGTTGTFEGVTIHTVDDEGKTTEIVQSIDLLSYFIQVGAISPMILSPVEKPTEMDGAGTVKLGGVKEI
eukprot:TRINITY_DN3399_c2_g1_i1.p1 TRINITY_DN3399_c2_g1~~TRINITY_DN3399_c2_g1_i1.p1  ORF type:complete len:176 (+),score=34.86 TRINITY_DN3399_c2_g1_i1:46-573(+)